MKYNEKESKNGLYDVFYTEDGQKIIVLEGLSIEDQYEAPPLQQIIHNNFEIVVVFYWVLFIAVLSYLVGIHILIPLIRKSKDTSD